MLRGRWADKRGRPQAPAWAPAASGRPSFLWRVGFGGQIFTGWEAEAPLGGRRAVGPPPQGKAGHGGHPFPCPARTTDPPITRRVHSASPLCGGAGDDLDGPAPLAQTAGGVDRTLPPGLPPSRASVASGLLQGGRLWKWPVGTLCARGVRSLTARSACGPGDWTEVFGREHRPVSPPSDLDATCPSLLPGPRRRPTFLPSRVAASWLVRGERP